MRAGKNTFVSADSSQSATATEDAFFSEKERRKRRCLEFRLPLSFVRADHCSSQSNEGESAFSIIALTESSDSGLTEFQPCTAIEKFISRRPMCPPSIRFDCTVGPRSRSYKSQMPACQGDAYFEAGRATTPSLMRRIEIPALHFHRPKI